MRLTEAIKRGTVLVVENYKMVATVYAVNVALAAIITVPLFSHLDRSLSLRGDRIDMAQSFSYEWWSEFDFKAEGLARTVRPSLSSGLAPLFENCEKLLTGDFPSFGPFVFALGLGYLFLAAFFNGGAIALFVDEKRSFSVSRFFSYSGYYFHHLFALSLTAVLLFFILYRVVNPLLFGLADALTAAWLSERSVWGINLIVYLLIFAFVVFFNMIFDYAKIIVVYEKKDSSWLCIWLAIKFAFRNLGSAVLLYLSLAAVGAAMVLLFGTLHGMTNSAGMLLMIIAVLIFQLFIVMKIAWRLVFYAAQFSFYQSGQDQVRKLRKIR